MDCDFIIAFKLDHWPVVAEEWVGRPRHWPSQKIVLKIFQVRNIRNCSLKYLVYLLTNQVCCEVVPKAGLDGDALNWRLSFSQAEKILSEEFSERPRMTYLAAKIILKKYLQFSCPVLKSYHLKTIFLHYLEKKSVDYWKDNSIEKTITDFLGELLLTMEKKACSHYFIQEN